MRSKSDKYLENLIDEYMLDCPDNNKNFINFNPLLLSISDLSRIAEMANGLQEDTAAYYTDPKTVDEICKKLPNISASSIRICEPSVGVGNILREVIKFYHDKIDSIECDVFDINKHSLDLCKILIDKEFKGHHKLKINYIHADFLTYEDHSRYDVVVGNPPFIKIKGEYREKLRLRFNNLVADNISTFFLDKSQEISNKVILIMPKYFLHNRDFSKSREKLKNTNIQYIIDFGETGFKGVLIETICLFINADKPSTTVVISIPRGVELLQNQNDITQSIYPNWLIYIDKDFIQLAKQLEFDIFKVFRDRQVTSKMLSSVGNIWVIKSKNIPRSGSGVIHINNDAFIEKSLLDKLGVSKYLDRVDVFLSPNMTYYPRVVRKPEKCVVNGSVAILELKENINLTDEDLLFFSSQEFENFYRVARNYSTRSLNIDNIAIFYFGKRK